MHQHELELNIATLLLQYEIQLFKPCKITVKNDAVGRMNNDPVFHTTLHSITSLISQKDNAIDIYLHLTVDQNLQVLDDMNIDFSYNDKSRVALIRDGRNSIDFYPTKNKWKDNNDKNKIHYGNAHLLIKDGMDF